MASIRSAVAKEPSAICVVFSAIDDFVIFGFLANGEPLLYIICCCQWSHTIESCPSQDGLQ